MRTVESRLGEANLCRLHTNETFGFHHTDIGDPVRSTRLTAMAALAVATTLTLAACGTDTESTDTGTDADGAHESTQPDTDGSAEFPITITHAFGETVIESQPERPATVGWSNQEAALILGVVPVVMEAATWGDDDGDGVLPWVDAKLTELGAPTPALYDGTEGVDFEAIADANPDVILAAYSGLSQDDYDTLSQIAPVVAYPDAAWGTAWQDMLVMNGTALGLQAEAEAEVARLEQVITDKAAEYPNIDGQGAAFSWIDPSDLSSIGFYTLHDPRAVFLERIGFSVPGQVQTSTDGTDEFFASVSAEEVDNLSDVQVIVAYVDGAGLSAAQGDPLISRIPAIADGAVVQLGSDPVAAVGNPSPLAIESPQMDEYLALVDEAAGKAS